MGPASFNGRGDAYLDDEDFLRPAQESKIAYEEVEDVDFGNSTGHNIHEVTFWHDSLDQGQSEKDFPGGVDSAVPFKDLVKLRDDQSGNERIGGKVSSLENKQSSIMYNTFHTATGKNEGHDQGSKRIDLPSRNKEPVRNLDGTKFWKPLNSAPKLQTDRARNSGVNQHEVKLIKSADDEKEIRNNEMSEKAEKPEKKIQSSEDWLSTGNGNENSPGNNSADEGDIFVTPEKAQNSKSNENRQETKQKGAINTDTDQKMYLEGTDHDEMPERFQMPTRGKAKPQKVTNKKHDSIQKNCKDPNPLSFQHPLPGEEREKQEEKPSKKLKVPDNNVEETESDNLFKSGNERIPGGKENLDNRDSEIETNGNSKNRLLAKIGSARSGGKLGLGNLLKKNRKETSEGGRESLIWPSSEDYLDGLSDTEVTNEASVMDYDVDNLPFMAHRESEKKAPILGKAVFPHNIHSLDRVEGQTRNHPKSDNHFREVSPLQTKGAKSNHFLNSLQAREEEEEEKDRKSNVKNLGEMVHSNGKSKSLEDVDVDTDEDEQLKDMCREEQLKDFWDILKNRNEPQFQGRKSSIEGALDKLLMENLPTALPEIGGSNWRESDEARRELDRFLKQCRMNDRLYKTYGEAPSRCHYKHRKKSHHPKRLPDKSTYYTKTRRFFDDGY